MTDHILDQLDNLITELGYYNFLDIDVGNSPGMNYDQRYIILILYKRIWFKRISPGVVILPTVYKKHSLLVHKHQNY